jgi:N-acetylneuraminic acid mutarotase
VKRTRTAQSAFLNLRSSIAALLCIAVGSLVFSATLLGFFRSQTSPKICERTLSFSERVAYQRAIEDVYWRHRIWPKDNPDSKPSLDAVISQVQLEKKVEDYLLKSQALEDHWQQPITAEQLQAEIDRMAQHTRQPKVLRELFAALGDDPFIIAECLARPILSEHLKPAAIEWRKASLDSWRAESENQMSKVTTAASANYKLPAISEGPSGCVDNWTATSLINAPDARDYHTAVWTGSEMIIWGGWNGPGLNTGGRYDPTTDSWTATSTASAPTARLIHTAVWTGSEMIVWGGFDNTGYTNTGARYNPVTDSWTATSTTNAPTARSATAVWIGSEMIVWGGGDGGPTLFNTGGRYNPSTDRWTPTSTDNAPTAQGAKVWTGSEMIVWGSSGNIPETGGRYNPSTDSWTPTSTDNVPSPRNSHTAVWTGTEMIVWGGTGFPGPVNTGGRYDPSTDSWTATSINGAPAGRVVHTAVWTGSEMIVWGGQNPSNDFNSGGRYNPGTDSWTTTSIASAPAARHIHTAVWAGTEMIVWGGETFNFTVLNTGGRYCAQFTPPTPTPTAPPATPTATPRSTPLPRARPTPAPRP